MLKKTIKDISKPGNSTVLGQREMIFDENGMTVKTETTGQATKWPGVIKVEENSTTYFIYVSEAAFHVVPRYKTPSDEDAGLRSIPSAHVANVPSNL